MAGHDWGDAQRRALGMQIGNYGASADRILLLFNAADEDIEFELPAAFPCSSFRPVFDSTSENGLTPPDAAPLVAGGAFPLGHRSFVILQHDLRLQPQSSE